jgi:hypothetical protein
MLYSKEPAFNAVTEPAGITELVFRLVAFDQNEWFPQGACTAIASHLCVTAKHVILDFLDHFCAGSTATSLQVSSFSLQALQILDNPLRYAVWSVCNAYLSPLSDIALLHLAPYCTVADKITTAQGWKQVRLSLFPPSVAARIVGFGFHSSAATVTKNPQGGPNVHIHDKPTATVGEVRQVHAARRDSARLNFPCYQVNARFDGGMSGGPVFDESGRLCGIICSSFPSTSPEEEHASYVATLWPATGIPLDVKGVWRTLLDLTREGVVAADGWERIRLQEFPDQLAPGGILYGVSVV